MVYIPHRGNLPPKFGPSVPTIPDIGPAELDSSVYTDPARFEQERRKVLNRSWQIICRSQDIANVGDFHVWEGHGETIVISRRRDGGVSGFHNVCQHRGARIVPESGSGARRFTCRWHSWSYDLEGTLVGVPDREDFDQRQLAGVCAPPVECSEWGGWVWAVLAGSGVAPTLEQWIGDDIRADLGAYRMEDMELHDKLEWELEANWKVVIDGFNENYHAAHLHTISPQDVKDGRFSTYFVSGRNGMMVIPTHGVLPELIETGDHQSLAICHYTIFPTAVFNNNPNHIQMFRSVPMAVDRTRFEVWELRYRDGDQQYRDKVATHWERLKGVVAEDVEIYQEWAAARRSTAYTRNVFNDRECKITHFHKVVQDMLDADD